MKFEETNLFYNEILLSKLFKKESVMIAKILWFPDYDFESIKFLESNMIFENGYLKWNDIVLNWVLKW